MKKRLYILGTILLIVLAVTSAPGLVRVGADEVTFAIDGMTCGSCASTISQTLSGLDGVGEANVDFASGEARVRYDSERTSAEALAQAVRKLGYGAQVRPAVAQGTDASCSTDSAAATPAVALGETPALSDDLQRVADYIVERVLTTGSTSFEDGEIAAATGVELRAADEPLLRQRVTAMLMASEEGQALFANSRCAAYEACSIHGNLSGATDDILAMYEREKAEDGLAFDDFELPEFTAHDLAGNATASADLRGRPTLLAFVSVHCQHSMDSLPILQGIHDTYGPRGLRVVAVAVNSGEVEDVNTWFPQFEPTYEVWVKNGGELSDAIGSHLVPTYFLIDEQGRITEKLVGFKESGAVVERVLARLVAGDGPVPRQEAASVTAAGPLR